MPIEEKPLVILVGCTGNTDRSPMVAPVLEYFLRMDGRQNIEVISRGLNGDTVMPISPNSAQVVSEFFQARVNDAMTREAMVHNGQASRDEVNLIMKLMSQMAGHRAEQLKRAETDRADLVLMAEQAQVNQLT